jgi:shikimate kinase
LVFLEDSAIPTVANQFFILMGVAGSGKSSVGARVASLLDWTLVEADDHHSARN